MSYKERSDQMKTKKVSHFDLFPADVSNNKVEKSLRKTSNFISNISVIHRLQLDVKIYEGEV